MSINNNNNNAEYPNNITKKENLSKLIVNSLEDIEHRAKALKIKDIKINENIRSIKLKEKKNSKITEEILTKKEELKLLKELLKLKEQNSMNPEDIICSYLSFIISSNILLDNKLSSLMEKEININMKQKYINKLLGKEIDDNNYDLSIGNNITINKPIDISKFILKPKKKKIIDNGGDNLDNIFMNRINNNNLFSIKKNGISLNSSYEKIDNGITTNDKKKKETNFNKFINKDLTKFQKYNINSVNISKLISNNNTNNKSEEENNYQYIIKDNKEIKEKEKEKEKSSTQNYSLTDKSDYINYNLKPNKRLKSARETFKKILKKINKSDEINYSSNKTDEFKQFILYVMNTNYFLRKILYICYETFIIYNVDIQKTVEIIHDNEFIDKLIGDYEDVGEKNEIKELNNIKKYENGLEEIKKVTSETKLLENEIIQFAHKVNIYE